MKVLFTFNGRSDSWTFLFCTITVFALIVFPIGTITAQGQRSMVRKDNGIEFIQAAEVDVLPGFDIGEYLESQEEGITTPTGTDLGSESEPNDTFATADPLTGTNGRITGRSFTGGAPATLGSDTDFYSFTTTNPNSRVFASTQTSGSGGGTNTTLALIGSDGTTVIESDSDDGSMSASSGNLAGVLLPTPGTYYLRVTNASATAVIAPYELYFAIKGGAATAEVEPNNNGGTPNAMPSSGFVSGTINPAADNDTFSFSVNAGETVYVGLDTDPERDNVQWNARLGVGTFGTPLSILLVNDASTGSASNPLSEGLFLTVKNSGNLVVYIDDNAAGGAATSTYNLSVMRFPAVTFAGTCTTYTNSTPTAIADLALTSSAINIPDSKIIKSLRVTIDYTHQNPLDLDVNLRSPADNNTLMFNDVNVGTQTGPQVFNLRDEAVIPVLFGVINGIISKPQLNKRLHWMSGENAQGTWNLDVRDDTTANTGTLNSWSLEVCEAPALTGNVVYSQDFESNDGGYTHTGTGDEWEYGTPATPGTTTAQPVAIFNTCSSGTKCWKTDLDNTYNASSVQDLSSPSIDLNGVGGPINLYWQARYQVESGQFDHAWVSVSEVGNPSNTRVVWLNDGSDQTSNVGSAGTNVAGSAGWGRYDANISDFSNKVIRVNFHLDGDSSFQFGGFAIDDVAIRGAGVVAAPSTITGKLETNTGRAVSGSYVTLSEQNGTKHMAVSNAFGYFAFYNILSQQTVTLSVRSKRYTFELSQFNLPGNTNVVLVGTPTP